jgi:hypothetical protein
MLFRNQHLMHLGKLRVMVAGVAMQVRRRGTDIVETAGSRATVNDQPCLLAKSV